jgi:ribosomal protein L11 methyltransferase
LRVVNQGTHAILTVNSKGLADIMPDWLEVKVVFRSENPQTAADLIADLFFECGLSGVVIDDPNLEPEEGWGSNGTGSAQEHAVTGYFPDTRQAKKQCREMRSKLADFDPGFAFEYEIALKRIDEEAWSESWKIYFNPVHVTERIVIKPTWREYAPRKDEIVLEIDPGMAFGTGTHPTTAMCIHHIEKRLKPGSDFLDVGTGSGILMLTAAAMGAKSLTGIDRDEIAVRTAAENMRQNHIEPKRFGLAVGNLADSIRHRYDFIAANILSKVILVLLNTIHDRLKNGGILVCSGIVFDNAHQVTQKMLAAGYEILEIMRREEWVSIVSRLS